MFYASDTEMEEEEVSVHIDGSSQAFRDRVNGGDRGKKDGLLAWPCDLALYALKSDVLVVLLDTQRMSASTDEAKVFEELWFDPVVEAPKKRVVCIVMDRDHFELAVVHAPEARFLFDRGTDWDSARSLVLAFVRQRVPGMPLGPKWEPPVGSAFAISLRQQGSFSPCLKAVSSPLSLSSPCRNKAVYSQPSIFSLSFPPSPHHQFNLGDLRPIMSPHNKEERKSEAIFLNQSELILMAANNEEMSKSVVEQEVVGKGGGGGGGPHTQ